MDNRDSKGRFKKKDEFNDENCGVFNRAPTLKTMLLLILVTWLIIRWSPSSSELKDHGCNAICWRNQTLLETDKSTQIPPPVKPKL